MVVYCGNVVWCCLEVSGVEDEKTSYVDNVVIKFESPEDGWEF